MVVASTDSLVVSADDVPPEVLAKEREVEMGKEDIKSKPEAIRWGLRGGTYKWGVMAERVERWASMSHV